MSQYKANLKNLLAISDQIQSAGDRLESAVAEIPSIAKTLQDMGCYDAVFIRLMRLQRTGEKQYLDIKRMGTGLKEIADIYTRFERRALAQVESGDVRIAYALPALPEIHRRRTPASLYRDEWSGNARIGWWEPQISEEQRARLQPVWFEAAQLLPLRNMFTVKSEQ